MSLRAQYVSVMYGPTDYTHQSIVKFSRLFVFGAGIGNQRGRPSSPGEVHSLSTVRGGRHYDASSCSCSKDPPISRHTVRIVPYVDHTEEL